MICDYREIVHEIRNMVYKPNDRARPCECECYTRTYTESIDGTYYSGIIHLCECSEFTSSGLPLAACTCSHLCRKFGEESEFIRTRNALCNILQNGGTVLTIGQTIEVNGSTGTYTIKLNEVPRNPKYNYGGPWLGCTCNSWKYGNYRCKQRNFQLPGKHPAMRTCIHLTQTFGEIEEIYRVCRAYAHISAQGWMPKEPQIRNN